MKKLYSFYSSCGRDGNVEGLFVAEEKDVKNVIGKKVYFGEILGKHSEVFGVLENGDFEKVNVSAETVKELVDVFGGDDICGYNPLKYLYEDEW